MLLSVAALALSAAASAQEWIFSIIGCLIIIVKGLGVCMCSE